MDRAEVLRSLQEAVDTTLGDEAPVLGEDVVLADSMIDSLDLIEVMMCVEDTLGIVLDTEDFSGVVDVGGLVDVVCAKLEPVHG